VIKNITNLPASVHQCLLNIAGETFRPFNEVLQHFAIERFLYRLSRSPNADRFVLKGALMLSVWSESVSRPTMDIDLLGRIDNSLGAVVSAVKCACRTEVEDDGMSFSAETVTATRITEEAEYEGVCVRVRASLGKSRITLQIDVGFGDVVIPAPCKVTYPGLLDFPLPKLSGYTMESTIAEKFQAMARLGVVNSRMKDFYDVWMRSRTFDFRAELLAEAVERAFANRDMPMSTDVAVFSPSFGQLADKQVQWQGFVSKARLADAPDAFEDVAAAVRAFLEPTVASLTGQRPHPSVWGAPGPWS